MLHVSEKTMSNKNNSESSVSITDEVKEQNTKYNLSKFDYDLYYDEDNISQIVIRVKRVALPNKGERWKVMQDNKLLFVVEGTKLTNKEKDFLRTVDGVNFLIAQAKSGIKSFNALRAEIKKKLNKSA